jgi:putative hydrolase of the HAD superfamily
MAIHAVAFDLDDTLVVTDRDRQTLLDEATDAAGVRDIARREYLDAHGADLASETRAPIFDAVLDNGDSEAVSRAYRDAVNDALVPVPGVPDLLTELRERYCVGLLTDGPSRAQRSKLERLGWTDLFDAVVVTGELEAGKPDPRAFAALTDRLGVPPEETVYVGDNPTADVRGAKRAGMLAVQVLGAADDEPDPTADATVVRGELVEGVRNVLSRQQRL